MSEITYIDADDVNETVNDVQAMSLMGARVMVGLYDDEQAQLSIYPSNPMIPECADLDMMTGILPEVDQ